jgi:hypothetical protein
MDPIVVGIVSLIALVYIFWPLFMSKKNVMLGDHTAASSEITRMNELSEKLEQMVTEKEDLEFEHEMGKLSDEDFTRLLGETTSETDKLSKVMGALKVKEATDEAIEKNILEKRKMK